MILSELNGSVSMRVVLVLFSLFLSFGGEGGSARADLKCLYGL